MNGGRKVFDWSKELESARRDLEGLVESDAEKEFSTEHLFAFSLLESAKRIEKTPERKKKEDKLSDETTPVPRGNSRIKPTEPVNLSEVFDVPLQVEDLKKATPSMRTRPPLVPVGASELSLSKNHQFNNTIDIPEEYEYASTNQRHDIENLGELEFKPPILFAEERKRWHNSLRSYQGNKDCRPLWGKGTSFSRETKLKKKKKKKRRLNKTPPYLKSLKDIKLRRGNRSADFVGWAAHDRRRYEAPTASFGPQNLIVHDNKNRISTSSTRQLKVKTAHDKEFHAQSNKNNNNNSQEEEKKEEEMKESIPTISMPPGLKSPRRQSISRNKYVAEISIPEPVCSFQDEHAKDLLLTVDDDEGKEQHKNADSTSPKRGRRSPRRQSISRHAFVTNESRSIHLSVEPAKENPLSPDNHHRNEKKPIARRRSVSEKPLKPLEKSPQKHISESPSKKQGLSAAIADDIQVMPSVPGRTVVSRLDHNEFDAVHQPDEKKHYRPSLCVVPIVKSRNIKREDVVTMPSTVSKITELLRASRGSIRNHVEERKTKKKKKKIEEQMKKKKKSARPEKSEKTNRRADHKDWKTKSSRRRGSYFGMYAKPKKRLSEDQKTLWRNGIVRSLRRAIASRRSLFGCHLEPWNLDDVFDTIDRSEDGYVDQSELANALQRLDITLSKSQLEDLFEHIDRNTDGLIQLVEFKSLLRSAVQSTSRWIQSDVEGSGADGKKKKREIVKTGVVRKKQLNIVRKKKKKKQMKNDIVGVVRKNHTVLEKIGTRVRHNKNQRVRLEVLRTWVTRLLLKTRKIRNGKRMEVARTKWRTRRLRLGLRALHDNVTIRRQDTIRSFKKWKKKTKMARIESLRSHWIGWCEYVCSRRRERRVRREKEMERDFNLLSNVLRGWRLYTDRMIVRREKLQQIHAMQTFYMMRTSFETWREVSERAKREIQACVQIQKLCNMSRIRTVLREWQNLTTRYQIFRHTMRKCLLRSAFLVWNHFVLAKIRDTETSKMDRFMDSLVRDEIGGHTQKRSCTKNIRSRSRSNSKRRRPPSSLLRSVFAAWHMYVLMRRGFRDTKRRSRRFETKKSIGGAVMSTTSGPLSFRDLHSNSSNSRGRKKKKKKIIEDIDPESDILVEAILRKNRGELFRRNDAFGLSSSSSRGRRGRYESKRSGNVITSKKKKWEPISLLVRRKLPSPSLSPAD